ncbi:MAG: DUF839 domain-containing protein [Thiothrix sp.]|uniref:alkaline phosphatase PhoX n=1 Tax=Thiothrix sp. TaxID=1032 RepID=UPI00261FC023|nr:alkaline phosphatase PhoX [Thiothrix sp.]MDD5393056.1 DUF839 domain-containing protein [Thiothrix sp.]
MRFPILLSSLLVLLAVAVVQAGSPKYTLEFKPLVLPTSAADKLIPRATSEVTLNGEKQVLAYHELLRSGDQDNGETFGLMKNVQGQPIDVDGKPYICNGTNGTVGSGLDFNAILHDGGKLYLMSQFECNVGGMYMTQLQQDKDGQLSPVKNTLQFIDQSKDFGGYVHCAGSVTPWNSLLGSEEYEPDAANIEKQVSNPDGITDKKYVTYPQYYWQDDLKKPAKSSPYMVGWITEAHVNGGKGSYTKHYALGRFSHELAYVLPDQQTVYLTDDGDNGTLFMFVADKVGDLSAGTLYAAVWNQTNAQNGGAASLAWVSLGHASDAEIKPAIQKLTAFSDLFETGDADHCDTANGFKLVSPAGFAKQCLKVKPGKELLASRLESRRYAALKGATHEFRKMEGFTYDTQNNRGFLALSEIGRGMLDNVDDPEEGKNYDAATGNHIRLDAANYCGGVYTLSMQGGGRDTDGNAITSNLVAGSMKALLTGGPGGEKEPQGCTIDNLAQPDNVTFLADSNTLIIGEDGEHENNIVWAYDLGKGKATRIFSAPLGAETTAPYWFTGINGWSYLTTVVQHPNGKQAVDARDKESMIGYIGPLKGL